MIEIFAGLWSIITGIFFIVVFVGLCLILGLGIGKVVGWIIT
jgi:hypothetical protein